MQQSTHKFLAVIGAQAASMTILGIKSPDEPGIIPLAACTASIASVRMVLMHKRSAASLIDMVTFGRASEVTSIVPIGPAPGTAENADACSEAC